MAQVFTSYSRRDTETVDSIVAKMSQAGINVWIDRADIKAGNTWRVQIVQAIDTCHAFVLMLSPNSAASDNVRKEIDLSQDSGRTIFAVMLEPTKLPAEIRYQLAGLQFIDVQMLGFDKAVSLLVETVKEHLARFGPVEEPETRQAELVIQGIDLSAFTADKQAQLLDFIAKLTSADRAQLQIANLTAGSVHVFVELPAQAAFELKTRALNRDERFKQLGIVSLRLDGDVKYVNTASGALTLAATASPSLTPVPTFAILTGELVNRVACRHGPGDIYLYRFGLIPGNRMEVRGRVDRGSGRLAQTWLWGLPEFFPDVCWVNARDVNLDGDLSGLEVVYPDKVDLPFLRDPRWPVPQNVEATRQGDEVAIRWDFFDVPLGEREGENSPRYVLEAWLCQDGQVRFTPIPVYTDTNVSVVDQAGCAEPSHGRIVLSEKHGYVGPVEIEWP